MARITTRPNATDLNAGFAVTGAASAQAALSDNSDASYLQFPGTNPQAEIALQFAEPAGVPAGAVLTKDVIRARVSKVTPDNSPMRLIVLSAWPRGTAGDQYDVGMVDISAESPTTMTLLTVDDSGARTDYRTDLFLLLFNSGGVGFLYELYWDTVYVPKPVVNTVTLTPASPVGTTDQPTVKWTETLDVDGGGQTKFQVRTFTAAQYGIGGFDPATSPASDDSGVVSSAAKSYKIGTNLVDATYRSYVRVGQTVNGTTHWSDYTFGALTWTLAVLRPAVPATPVPTAGSANGRIIIPVAGGGGGATTTTWIQLQRSDDGGVSYSDVRTLDGSGRVAPGATARDYEPGNGQVVQYRARAIHTFASGFESVSAWVNQAGTISWASSDRWLKHPTNPALNLKVEVWNVPTIERTARVGEFQPLGSAFTITTADKRSLGRGSLTIDAQNDSDRFIIDALLNDTVPLLLQLLPADSWPDRWLMPVDTHTRERMVDKFPADDTLETFGWVQVVEPGGNMLTWT